MEGGTLRDAACAAAAGEEATKVTQSIGELIFMPLIILCLLHVQWMEGMAGRSNYVPRDVLNGIPDPGAAAVSIIFAALSSV